MVNPWKTMVLYGQPWYSLVNHGTLWSTMVLLGQPWYSLVNHGAPWSTTVLRGQPWNSAVNHGTPWSPWNSMLLRGQPGYSEVNHGWLWWTSQGWNKKKPAEMPAYWPSCSKINLYHRCFIFGWILGCQIYHTVHVFRRAEEWYKPEKSYALKNTSKIPLDLICNDLTRLWPRELLYESHLMEYNLSYGYGFSLFFYN